LSFWLLTEDKLESFSELLRRRRGEMEMDMDGGQKGGNRASERSRLEKHCYEEEAEEESFLMPFISFFPFFYLILCFFSWDNVHFCFFLL